MIEDFDNFVKEITGVVDNQAELTAKLTKIIEHNTEIAKTNQDLKTENTELLEKNKELRSANMDLFLQVGRQAGKTPPPRGSETPTGSGEAEKLTYENLDLTGLL